MAYTKTAKLVWTGEDLTFDGILDSGYPLTFKTTADDEGASPMSVFLSGVAGCTAMDVLSILKKKRQQINGIEIEIIGQRAETTPMVFTEVDIMYIVYGKDIDPVAVERSIELSQTKYCSASITLLRAGVTVRTRYEIREA